MADTLCVKRLILRAVLRQVSPMVIRLVSVSDQLQLPEFHNIFRAILGWTGDLGYIIRVHGLDPNYATAHQWYAEYLCYMGRFEEAFRMINRAHELEPQ